MTADTAPATPPRPRPAWIGLALLAFWLGWILPSLAALRPAPVTDPGWDATQITAQLRMLGVVPGQGGQALAVRLQRRGCRCGTPAQDRALRDTLGRQQVHVVALAPQRGTPPFSLVVFDAAGALRYAGPLDIATGCGRRGVPAGAVIASLLASPRARFLSPDPCPCSEVLSV